MSHPVKGVDHCFVLVNDLENAAARYRALGFTLSPRGLHSAAKGTANYTIMFPDDYFELLGLLTATPLNAARAEALAQHGQGLHAIACRIGTAVAAEAALNGLGIATHGLGSFARPVPLPGGGEAMAAFSTLMFDGAEVPMGTVFMCEHQTPETVWLPELLGHPNTACGLEAILLVSDTPKDDAERFARLWEDGRVIVGPQGYTVHTGPNSAPLKLMTPSEVTVSYPDTDMSASPTGVFLGLQVKVRDMASAQHCLDSAGIAAATTARGIAVAPQDTSGVLLEFVSQ